jgi:hypothetical protein
MLTISWQMLLFKPYGWQVTNTFKANTWPRHKNGLSFSQWWKAGKLFPFKYSLWKAGKLFPFKYSLYI